MNSPNLECVNITNDTPKELNKETSKDTTKKWERICPQCNKIIFYTRKDNRDTSVRKNKICNDCKHFQHRTNRSDGIIIINGETKWSRNCPKCGDVIYHKNRVNRNVYEKLKCTCVKCSCELRKNDDKTRYCPKCNKPITYQYHYIKNIFEKENSLCKECEFKRHSSTEWKEMIFTDEWKSKVSKGVRKSLLNMSDELKNKRLLKFRITCNSPRHRLNISLRNRGRKLSDDTKRKQRLSKIKYIQEKNGGIRPMCNINACIYLDELNKERGYNLQHSQNGGEYHIKELGYFVDGYDKENNIVVEYDEKHHFNSIGDLKEKDIRRMNEIKEYLKCKFLRYNEKSKELKEY